MNIAVVPVYTGAVLEWLGPATPLDRLLSKLFDVRELDEIRLVSPTGHVDCRVQGETRLRQVKTGAPIPPLIRLCRIFHVGVQREDVYLACDPAYPFLDRSRIESVLHSVLSGEAQTAMTSERRGVLSAHSGKMEISDQVVYAGACVGLRIPPGEPSMGACSEVGSAVQGVEISAIEAVSVSTPEGKRLAEALALGFA